MSRRTFRTLSLAILVLLLSGAFLVGCNSAKTQTVKSSDIQEDWYRIPWIRSSLTRWKTCRHVTDLLSKHERITGVTTTLPLLIGAFDAKLKTTVVVAQRFCSLLVCGYGRKRNEFFVAASAASFWVRKTAAWLRQTLCVMPGGGKWSGSEAIVYNRAVGCIPLPRTAGSQVNNGPCERKEFLGKGLFGFTARWEPVKGEYKSTTSFCFCWTSRVV